MAGSKMPFQSSNHHSIGTTPNRRRAEVQDLLSVPSCPLNCFDYNGFFSEHWHRVSRVLFALFGLQHVAKVEKDIVQYSCSHVCQKQRDSCQINGEYYLYRHLRPFGLLRLLPALESAMATACFCGLPAALSVRMFALMVFWDLPFLSGISFYLWYVAIPLRYRKPAVAVKYCRVNRGQ